jgi:hypothetical protein
MQLMHTKLLRRLLLHSFELCLGPEVLDEDSDNTDQESSKKSLLVRQSD